VDEPGRFERDYGCTEGEWLRWLPGAVGPHALETGPGCATVRIGGGLLSLRWAALPPRRIALLSLPHMAVHFAFDEVDAADQAVFMRYFDLYMQRGGG
jgi:hypothetical protein